ncbi:MAG: GNA1162 family protein [Nitrospirota bacterium]
MFILFFFPQTTGSSTLSEKEIWDIHPDYENLKPQTIAVLPMDNFSLEPKVEKVLYQEVYSRLNEKGYMKISVDHVRSVMHKFGISTPGQLAGIEMKKLCNELKCDAVISGQIEQSGTIHAGVYDAVVVSCSLRLTLCSSGQTIWQTEQWRTAHRQWQLDPINLFINVMAHENTSRADRVAWLVSEMLKTLPKGPIAVEYGDLLMKAKEIPVENE